MLAEERAEAMKSELDRLRTKLLDLTFRNRLLKYRPSKQRTLTIVDEMPTEVFRLLVLEEKAMSFSALRPGDVFIDPDEDEGSFDQIQESLWDVVPAPEELHERHTDLKLQTPYEADKLQKRLFYINQKAREVLEEQGYGVLFLALGFLKWREETQGDEDLKAPLILVPVELVRTRAGRSFRVKWTGDEVVYNISLREKLRDYSVELPEFGSDTDDVNIDAYFTAVSEAIRHKASWAITQDIHLDFFSFTKFVMYKDLDPSTWTETTELWEKPLLADLLSPARAEGFSEGEPVSISDDTIDWRYVHHVMDSDPSQMVVIERTKSGHNLVVEGPPGTGKSQTIANIIAELLVQGKTVLFVSEKMAALEVVKSRLDSVGLGFACLELHSRKTNKKEFLADIKRTLRRTQVDPAPPDSLQQKANRLRAELNAYATALRETVGATGKNPYTLFGMFEQSVRHFEDTGNTLIRVNMDSRTHERTESDWEHALYVLDNLVVMLRALGPPSEHPWRAFQLDLILPRQQEEAGTAIQDALTRLSKLLKTLEALSTKTGLAYPDTPAALRTRKEAAQQILEMPELRRENLESPLWSSRERVVTLISALREFQAEREYIAQRFGDNPEERDWRPEIEEFRSLSTKFFAILNGRYRTLKRKLRSAYSVRRRLSNSEIVTDFQHLLVYLQRLKEIRHLSLEAGDALGSVWNGPDTSHETVERALTWITAFKLRTERGEIARTVFYDALDSGLNRDQIRQLWNAVCQAERELDQRVGGIINEYRAKFEDVFDYRPQDVSWHRIRTTLEGLSENVERMQQWSQYRSLYQQCAESIAAPLLEVIARGEIDPEDVIPCFKGNYAEALLTVAFRERDALRSFDKDQYEKRRTQFADADRESIRLTQKYAEETCTSRIPPVQGGASPNSEAGILLGQMQRQRGHMPIRRLLKTTGKLIQKIKPCFMMSPLSVAQYLDPRITSFDVIVFDEASQVKPEDGIGAVLRGNQLLVVGDTKQLPPTSFFDIDRIDEDDEDDPVARAADVESILHQCLRAFDCETLKWHYRSRHHSLIAVSNHQFYDNALNVFPSPTSKTEVIGMQFQHVPEGVYGRGRSQTNPEEAKRVVAALIKHLEDFPDKTIGIGTFNIKQQQLILELIEFEMIRRPDLEPFFSNTRAEPVFVKNLETIQGDERDVILISVCYGFDETGRLTSNFGPVNKDGGHRRLNVLFTRAREKCVVFSNFRADDLKLPATAGYGPKSLKMFLEFAEKGAMPEISMHATDSDSPFEESVYEFLRANGHEVHKQVGCAGYRIDLAVVDPQHPGRYLLGVECDGYRYHRSVVARERDRLRQQILEDKGWSNRIHRIWSTDWYRHRQSARDNLLLAIEAAKSVPYDFYSPRPSADVAPTEPTLRDLNGDLEYTPGEGFGQVSTRADCGFIAYKVFNTNRVNPSSNFLDTAVDEVARLIGKIVSVEGPVHGDFVDRRIMDAFSIQRTGSRIKEHINLAKREAVRRGLVQRKANGFYDVRRPGGVVPRRRDADNLLDIEKISPDEVRAAVLRVLEVQYATPIDELAKTVGTNFGFQIIFEGIRGSIKAVVREMLAEGKLRTDQEERIDLIRQE
ncbi:MAG: DNA helicase [Candidatus Hydrogenedentota bacterium]